MFTLFLNLFLLNIFFYVRNLILLVNYILLLNSNFLTELNEILKFNKIGIITKIFMYFKLKSMKFSELNLTKLKLKSPKLIPAKLR